MEHSRHDISVAATVPAEQSCAARDTPGHGWSCGAAHAQRRADPAPRRCRAAGGRAGWTGWHVLPVAVLLMTTQTRTCTVKPTVNPVGATLGLVGTVTDPAKTPGSLGPLRILADGSEPKREHLTIMVGSELRLNISASWGAPYLDHNLTLYAYEEPGVPNGAVLTTQQCRGGAPMQPLSDSNQAEYAHEQSLAHAASTCNPVRRIFTWRPSKGQEGQVYSMCFLALPKELPQCQSEYKCIDMEVVAPNMSMVRLLDPGSDADKRLMKQMPALSGDASHGQRGIPAGGEEEAFHAPVGCHFKKCFEITDLNEVYEMDLAWVEGTLPADAQFDSQCNIDSASSLPYTWDQLTGVATNGITYAQLKAAAGTVHPLFPANEAGGYVYGSLSPPVPRRTFPWFVLRACWLALRLSETLARTITYSRPYQNHTVKSVFGGRRRVAQRRKLGGPVLTASTCSACGRCGLAFTCTSPSASTVCRRYVQVGRGACLKEHQLPRTRCVCKNLRQRHTGGHIAVPEQALSAQHQLAAG